MCGHIREDQRSDPDDRSSANADAWPDEALRCNPGFGFDGNRPGEDGKRWIAAIMGTRAEIATLGNDNVISDNNLGKAVELNPVTDPRAITDRDLPGIGDSDGGSNQRFVPQLGSKQAKNPSSPSVQCLRARVHKERLNNPPQLHQRIWTATESFGEHEACEILDTIRLTI
jgi:hypothetical protein